jgi:hypothetical protein
MDAILSVLTCPKRRQPSLKARLADYIQLDIVESCGRGVSLVIRSGACETSPRARGMMWVTNSTEFNEATSPTTSSRCPPIGKGVEEIRVSESSGAYRVIYLARRAEAVYVLHALRKKTQATPRKDLEIAKGRFRQLLGGRI